MRLARCQPGFDVALTEPDFAVGQFDAHWPLPALTPEVEGAASDLESFAEFLDRQ